MTQDADTQPLHPPTNDEIAQHLEQIADFLAVQEANPHRVNAYRAGAKSIRTTAKNVAQLARHKDEQAGEVLEDLPGIGRGLAWLIGEFVQTGHTGRLDRLRGESRADDRFRRIPGIGKVLAKQIVETLGIDTLPELEMAAHDGRLDGVNGFGPRRVQAVRDTLGTMLTRSGRRRQSTEAPPQSHPTEPSAETLLTIDRVYRSAAAAGRLRTIAPRRFNPEHKAWLPILHTEAAGWDFTALFSNTARAHELNKTNDWVVIYFDQDGHDNGSGHEGQCTVVTETTGTLKGKRVIRGREGASRQYYEAEEIEHQDG